MDKSKIPSIFLPALVIGVVIVAAGVMFYINGHKYKYSYQKVTGKIVAITKINKETVVKDPEKYRFIQIEGYPKIIQLFIGKDIGDAEPQMEKIDSLRIKDEITVYYSNDNSTSASKINRSVQFIDKGNRAYYVIGGQHRYFGYFVIGCGGVILALLLYLKSKGKIE